MYEKHFNLAAPPFNVSPDPRFLYSTGTVKEALSVMAYGVNARKGFVLLTGDVGTGKTTILNIFLEWLRRRNAATAFIFNPHLEPDEFLKAMMADFGVDCSSKEKSRVLIELNRWLLERHAAGQIAVLVIDEAQQLSAEVLEELRLLTNLETPTQKLLQIVLSGQPELNDILARPSLRQLRQRITLRCKTEAFSAEQTAAYIAQRLQVAGAGTSEIFEPEAVASIHEISGGIARVINLLCEQSLIDAYCDGNRKIGRKTVECVAQEFDLNARALVREYS